MPEASDLMFRFYMEPGSDEGRIGVVLSKRGVDYKAWLDLAGAMVLAKVDGGQETILQRKEIDPPNTNSFTRVQFANVDHQLIFEFDGNKLMVDLGRSPDALTRNEEAPTRAALFGSGKMALSHVTLFRDIHYTGDAHTSRGARAVERNPFQHTGDAHTSRGARAVEGNPFQLNDDEFFVLGDNSPNSEDGRWWHQPSVASTGMEPPRAGVVPRYYLVGKALFVYWPSGFEFPWPNRLKEFLLDHQNQNMAMRLAYGLVSLRWIPNVGRMRFIYGGTEQP
jgi:signal peptidase I